MRRVLLALTFLVLAAQGARGQTPAPAGQVVDRMIAVINGRELITYTDLLWQLALQPGSPLDAPRQEDLRRALELLINQRLISQEAEKLPSAAPTAREFADELSLLIRAFPSPAEFYARLSRVGLGEDSAQLREIIESRVRIQKYLDFRFRAFTVVTAREVDDYYREVFVPRRRRQAPGAVVPAREQVYKELEAELIESKVASDTDEFLEEARGAAEITILDKSFEGGR